MAYIYSLAKSGPELYCPNPNCGRKRFKRYRHNETLEYFPDPSVGRCNREDSCGYHRTPRQYYEANGIKYNPLDYQNTAPPPPKKPPTYIDSSFVEKAKIRPLPNYFVDYLRRIFQAELTNYLIDKFNLGNSKHWKGATVFWQIDQDFNVRAGKIMLYNSKIGKRVKAPFDHINWVHSVAKIKNFNIEQCFFGLHQIAKDFTSIIGIVESEKTAIIMTAILPDLTWLASGGMGLSIPKFEPLEGRTIILFPDAGLGKGGRGTPFEIWSEIADTLEILGFDISISNLLENKATEEQREKGYDLADYFTLIDQNGQSVLNLEQINK